MSTHPAARPTSWRQTPHDSSSSSPSNWLGCALTVAKTPVGPLGCRGIESAVSVEDEDGMTGISGPCHDPNHHRSCLKVTGEPVGGPWCSEVGAGAQ